MGLSIYPWHDTLDPGIRDLVMFLHGAGFHTTDSGDGVSKPGGLRSLPYAHVFISVSGDDLIEGSIRLLNEARRFGLTVGEQGASPWYVQATYDPCRGGMLMIAHDPEYHPKADPRVTEAVGAN